MKYDFVQILILQSTNSNFTILKHTRIKIHINIPIYVPSSWATPVLLYQKTHPIPNLSAITPGL